MTGPLKHVRVLDLSRIMAGPWASQLLADLGADVIKVERPGAGDDTRSWGPPFLPDANGAQSAESAYFLTVNRGKRSITVSLDKPEGQQIIRDLAADVDVVLENYKAGTLSRYGLDYDSLKAINPKLVFCSVTGFGQSGPRRDQAAYDFMIQAMGGLMSVTGERDDQPGGGPQKVGVPIVDIMTGMYSAVAILAALVKRDATGVGENIDIAMLDVQIAMLANQAMNYLISNKVPQRNGNSHPNIQPQDVFACRDGDLAVVVGNDKQFLTFCQTLGLTELATDERFVKNSGRVRQLDLLRPIILQRLKEKDRRDWVALLDAAGIPASPINSIAEAFEDPQVQHRKMLISMVHPLTGTLPQVASPMRFKESPIQYQRHPPMLGQHNDEVLRSLQLSDAQIEGLKKAGII